MAKLSAQEIRTKYAEKITDDDLLIELMEDVTDSISDGESEELSTLRSELESAHAEYEALKQKYKERFLTAITDEAPTETETNENVDIDLKDVIDVKEI